MIVNNNSQIVCYYSSSIKNSFIVRLPSAGQRKNDLLGLQEAPPVLPSADLCSDLLRVRVRDPDQSELVDHEDLLPEGHEMRELVPRHDGFLLPVLLLGHDDHLW